MRVRLCKAKLYPTITLLPTRWSILIKEREMRTLWGLKLDMAKAHNPMEWDFLGIVLEAFGFLEEFIKINLECISYVFFSTLIYGSSFGLVTPTKGLRSPLLKVCLSWVSMSSLECCWNKKRKVIHGAKVSRSTPSISHIFFANDSLPFYKEKPNEVRIIKDILDDYCFLSSNLFILINLLPILAKGCITLERENLLRSWC